MSLSGKDVVSAVRLMPPGRVAELAHLLRCEPSTRLDVLYKCITSRRARRKLVKFLHAHTATPERQMMHEPTSPPAAPSVTFSKKAAAAPACARCLRF